MLKPNPYISLFFAAAMLLAVHAAYYLSASVDDQYITLRYVQRFLQGKGLTWNDGEYVEGYSSLLWVLLNALLGYFSFDLDFASKFLSFSATVVTLGAFIWYAKYNRLPLPALVAGLAAFIIMPSVAMWAVFGMEAPLVMLCFGWCVVLCQRLLTTSDSARAAAVGGLLAIICLTRPEGPAYTLALAAALLFTSALPFAKRIKTIVIVCAIPALAFAAQLSFRLYYYGEWVSNSVLAKVAFSLHRLKDGFLYDCVAIFSFLPLLIYVMMSINVARKHRAQHPELLFIRFIGSVFCIIALFIWAGGGDIFQASRAFLPLVPIVILLTMHAVTIGLQYTPARQELGFFALIFAFHVMVNFSIDTNKESNPTLHWIHTAKDMGLALKKQYGAQSPTIAVFAAGAIPFYSELPTIDTLGLNDKFLTHHRYENTHFGQFQQGHELFNGRYIESRKPDIIALDVPGMNTQSICDYMADECAAFLSNYETKMLHTASGDIPILVRKDSAKLRD